MRGAAALEASSWTVLTGAAFAAGLAVAAHHPLSPPLALVGFVLWCAAAARWPGLWLFVLPAVLPAANLSPWTGWLVVDEFDLVVAGALVGGFAALARDAFSRGGSIPDAGTTRRTSRRWTAVLALFAASGLAGLALGLADARFEPFGWFQGYADPANSARVFKSSLHALFVLPLLRREVRTCAPCAARRVAAGMVAGLSVAACAVLWERVAYPGLFDFSYPYRTAALFWEMHVGGAAIDAYLAIAMPFVAWAVWTARSPLRWAGAAVLAVLAEYMCLTTFSRGVYVAVALPLLALRVWRWRAGRASGWRRVAGWGLASVLAIEAVAVIVPGSYMLMRLAASPHDFGSRLAHWRRGLDVLHGPAEWLLGTGLGRLPARYAASGAAGEFPGRLRLGADGTGRRSLTLSGPDTAEALGGLFALTQRVALDGGAAHRVELDLRVDKTANLGLSVCEMHLLYERRCQRRSIRVSPRETPWQHLVFPLEGPPLSAGDWYAPRLGVFAISVLDAGVAVELRAIGLQRSDHLQLLDNPDFARGLAHWLPAAQQYFLPWHIDNLYLETLIERGLLGLAALVGLAACALGSLIAWRGDPASPIRACLAASLGGALMLGLVSSFMDVPRVAFLFFLLAFLAVEVGARRDTSASH